jgi:hypothetical protein
MRDFTESSMLANSAFSSSSIIIIPNPLTLGSEPVEHSKGSHTWFDKLTMSGDKLTMNGDRLTVKS